MNNTKKWNAILRMVGFIAIVAMIGFSMAGCEEDGGDSSESVEVIANASGEIRINYVGGEVMTVKVTTDLPAPNNSFTFTEAGESKEITGLTPGQKVTVKISFSGKYSNIDVIGNAVYIQTYKN